MKRKNPHQNSLFKQKASTTIAPLVASPIEIKHNVCMEKNECPLCSADYKRNLLFILRYRDKSVQTVCFGCAMKAARKLGCSLPLTEERIEAKEARGDMKLIAAAENRMKIRGDPK